jgi:hypothetical protein
MESRNSIENLFSKNKLNSLWNPDATDKELSSTNKTQALDSLDLAANWKHILKKIDTEYPNFTIDHDLALYIEKLTSSSIKPFTDKEKTQDLTAHLELLQTLLENHILINSI